MNIEFNDLLLTNPRLLQRKLEVDETEVSHMELTVEAMFSYDAKAAEFPLLLQRKMDSMSRWRSLADVFDEEIKSASLVQRSVPAALATAWEELSQALNKLRGSACSCCDALAENFKMISDYYTPSDMATPHPRGVWDEHAITKFSGNTLQIPSLREEFRLALERYNGLAAAVRRDFLS